jgi:hypothetical protein
MSFHVTKRMKHTACGDKEFEDHIRSQDQFNSCPESKYLASLERRIKALEDRLKMSV